MINLGDRVEDKVSGYTGIAAARCEVLGGAPEILVAPERINEGGEIEAGEWILESMLRLVYVYAVQPEDLDYMYIHENGGLHKEELEQ